MNESKKTLIFVGVALALVVAAVATQPRQISETTSLPLGQPLFPEFSDPLKAKSLEIIRYDEKLAELKNFKVAQTAEGRWVIPSHSDYPADAENQLRDVATSLIDLRTVGIATEKREEHSLFQVLEPNKDKLKVGDKGVGTLIRIQGEKGKTLAELVIGDKDAKSPNQRFVRIPAQDHVFVVQYDLDKLSTQFEKWIEKDLLQLNALDVERIRLKDYSIVQTTRGHAADMRMEAAVKWDNGASKWELEELASYNGAKKIPTQLLDEEELNKEKLDGLKTALDQLEIVDVQRKPTGLSADLKADEGLLKNEESLKSLLEKGFFFAATESGKAPDLYAANGEVYVSMKEGYDYILRFGEVAGRQEGSDDGKLNRFLFVTTRLDESQFPPPQLEPEPKEDPKPAGPTTPADSGKTDTKKPAPPAGGQDGDGAGADDEKPAAAKADETKAADVKGDEKKPAEKKADDKKADDSKSQVEAERERIKKENERKLNEYREKKQKAENRVAELNARFADWYYVISDDTFKKIHLSRADIIKEKAGAKDEGFGVDAFRKLEKEGLKKTESSDKK